MGQSDAQQTDAAIGEAAIHHHDRGSDEYQAEGTDRLGGQAAWERGHARIPWKKGREFTGLLCPPEEQGGVDAAEAKRVAQQIVGSSPSPSMGTWERSQAGSGEARLTVGGTQRRRLARAQMAASMAPLAPSA